MQKITVPPIKCQGIKTKLTPWIKETIPGYSGMWIEPFMGSGVVGFNICPQRAIFADTNPHLINFYNDLKNNIINSSIIRSFLETENDKLLKGEDDYFKEVRARFNKAPNSLDFLFLNRSCFNGIIRFNNKGYFNTPFCKKPNRFAPAYITKICNQANVIQEIIQSNNYTFLNQSFEKTIEMAEKNDLIYCDPPYIDRYSDYFNGWDKNDEEKLFSLLSNTEAKFILSTWKNNKYRQNQYIESFWSKFNMSSKDHFYFVGGKESNRNSMNEALVFNFT